MRVETHLSMRLKYLFKTVLGNDSHDTELLRMCSSYECEYDDILSILKRGADPNAVAVRYTPFAKQPLDGQMPLHLVCSRGAKVEVIRLLIDSGANADARAPIDGSTPLICAASGGSVKVL